MASFDPIEIRLPGRVRLMQIITLGLIAGVIIFAAIILYLHQRQAVPAANFNLPIISIVAGVVLVQGLLVILFLAPYMEKAALKQLAAGIWPPLRSGGRPGIAFHEPAGYYVNDAGKLLGAYGSQLIVKLAVLEGAAFLGVIAYMIEGQTYSLIVPGIALGLMAAQFPTPTAATNWVENRLLKLEELKSGANFQPQA